MSLLGWISTRGSGLVAMYSGAVNHSVFERFVEEKLAPAIVKGDVVVWDNATTHSKGARQMIEAAGGEVVPLPRYSPEMNPIEMLWSQVKRKLRRRRPDTAERLRAALAEAAQEVNADDLRAYAHHCGFKFQLS